MSSARIASLFCALFVTAVAANQAWSQDLTSYCQQLTVAYQETYVGATAREGSVSFCARPEQQIAEPAGGCASLVGVHKVRFESAGLANGGGRFCIPQLIEDSQLIRDAEVVEGDYRCNVPWDAKLVKLADGTFACARKTPDLVSMLNF